MADLSVQASDAGFRRKYDYQQFQKQLEEGNFSLQQKEDGSLQMGGELVYLNRKLQVIVGETPGNFWQRLVHKVLQTIGRRPRDLSFEHYRHKSLSEQSRKLKSRLSSILDIHTSSSSSLKSVELAKKEYVEHLLPASVITECHKQGMKLSVSMNGHQFKIFDHPLNMYKHLVALAKESVTGLPMPETSVIQLHEVFLQNCEEGMARFFKGECSWDEALNSIRKQNEKIIGRNLLHPVPELVEKARDEDEQRAYNGMTFGPEQASHWHQFSEYMLSVLSYEAKQICCATKRKGKLYSVFTVTSPDCRESLKFKANKSEEVVVEKDTAMPKPYINLQEKVIDSDEVMLCKQQSYDVSKPSQAKLSVVTRGADYQHNGANRLSLNGFFYHPDNYVTSQLKVTRKNGEAVQLFNSKEEMEAYIQSIHEYRESDDKREVERRLKVTGDEIAAMSPEYLNAKTVPAFKHYLDLARFPAEKRLVLGPEKILVPGPMTEAEDKAWHKWRQHQPDLSEEYIFESAKKAFVQDWKNKNFRDWKEEGMLFQKMEWALNPGVFSSLEQTRDSLKRNLAYIELKSHPDASCPWIMLSPADSIVMAEPLDEGEQVSVALLPISLNSSEQLSDGITLSIGKQSCTLREPFEPMIHEVFINNGKTRVKVFESRFAADHYLSQCHFEISEKIALCSQMIDKIDSSPAKLEKSKNQTREKLTTELAQLKHNLTTLDNDVAWLFDSPYHLIFARAIAPKELEIKEREYSLVMETEDTPRSEFRIAESTEEIIEGNLPGVDNVAVNIPVFSEPPVLDSDKDENAAFFSFERAVIDTGKPVTQETASDEAGNTAFFPFEWATSDTDKPVTPEAETLYNKRINYLKTSLFQRLGSVDVSDKPFTCRLLREMTQEKDFAIGADTLERMLACIYLHEQVFNFEDKQALQIPVQTMYRVLGIAAEKAANPEEYAGDIYFELFSLYQQGQFTDKKMLRFLMKQIPGYEKYEKTARLLIQIEKHRADMWLSLNELPSITEQNIERYLVQQYAEGVIPKKELFALNYTQQDIMYWLGVDLNSPPEAQFQTLHQKMALGAINEPVFAELCGGISGGKRMYNQLRMVNILEPGKLVNMPARLSWDDEELPKNIVSKANLKACMKRYFGSPLPKNNDEAFNRFYQRAHRKKIRKKPAFIQALRELGGEEKVQKLNKLSSACGSKQITDLVAQGEFNLPTALNKKLVQACAGGQVSVTELFDLGIKTSEIIRYLSTTDINKLVAERQLSEEMLQEAGISSAQLTESGKRTELLQAHTDEATFKNWETARELSDNFVQEQLLELCASGEISPALLNATGIGYDKTLHLVSNDNRMALCLKGEIPVSMMSAGPLSAEWKSVLELNTLSPEEEQFAFLQGIIDKESRFPNTEKTIIPQMLPFVLENAPYYVMKQHGFEDITLDLEGLKKNARCLYAAGVLPAEAMHKMGFYEADLVKVKQEQKLPVSFDDLSWEIQIQLRFVSISNPEILQHFSSVASEEELPALPPSNFKFEQGMDKVPESIDSLPLVTEMKFSDNILQGTGADHSVVDSENVKKMEAKGFKLSHLDQPSIEAHIGQLYIAGVLSDDDLNDLGITTQAREQFSKRFSLPVRFKSLDRKVQKHFIRWTEKNPKRLSFSELKEVMGNFKGIPKNKKLLSSNERSIAMGSSKTEDIVDKTKPLKSDIEDSSQVLTSASAENNVASKSMLKKVMNGNDVPDEPEGRGALLAAIQAGKTLKKVEEGEKHYSDGVKMEKASAKVKTGKHASRTSKGVSEEPETSDEEGVGDPRHAAIMKLNSFAFLDDGKMIRSYYEASLGTRDYTKVKEKMAEDIVSGKLKKELEDGKLVLGSNNGWKKTLAFDDMGPLRDYLK